MTIKRMRFAAATAVGGLALVGFIAPAAQANTPSTADPTDTLTDVSGWAYAATPVTYADRLVRAWGAGHRGTAGHYATKAVVDKMFDYSDPGGPHWRRTGSQGAAGTIYVTYHDDARGGTMIVGVSDVLLAERANHVVREVRFHPTHPISASAYADRLIRAWGRGDHRAAEHYAIRSVVRKLFVHADPGGTHWHRVLMDGTAGTTYVTYQDGTRSEYLTVSVSDVDLGAGQTRDVHTARFSH